MGAWLSSNGIGSDKGGDGRKDRVSTLKTMSDRDRISVAMGLRSLAVQIENGDFDDYECKIDNGIDDAPPDAGTFAGKVPTGERLIRLMLYARPRAPFRAQHDPLMMEHQP
ncbi:MAG TPA: hypothetical protein VNH18_08160 [Bryobacteraceae bacterium]|nr:hypothetical protein [Bryobacteraceae bacterium]